MTEKNDTLKQIEESPVKLADQTSEVVSQEVVVKNDGNKYFFPREGINIEAESLEEAQKIYTKKVKDNKESDNG